MFDGTLLSVDRLVEGPARAGLTSFDKNCLCIGRGNIAFGPFARSKRLRLVSEQKRPRNGIFGFGRAKN